jgi:maleylpyruvate isomerase
MKPDESLAWTHDGTRRLLTALDGLPDQALTAPSTLPGWSRRSLVAHVAANADALRNLVYWARTGDERRMYSSPEQREADIAAGSTRPAASLRSWAVQAADALAADLEALPDAAWDATIITAQGVTRPAREIPWMRAREVYIHAIDLGTGLPWADLPLAFLAALLDDVTARRSAQGGGPALAVAATDTGQAWQVAGTGAPARVGAPLADLAAYLSGRQAPALPAAPSLPTWL